MSLPEDEIMKHLNHLLTSSSPGDELHHLHVIAVPADAVGPLGTADRDKQHVSVYAIAADHASSGERPEQFVARTVMAAALHAAQAGQVVLFAGLTQEAWAVDPMDKLAVELQRKQRLDEHPNVGELTLMYAATRDGRRWRGRRWLTGPQAGQTKDIETLVGRPTDSEAWGIFAAPLVRKLVGMAR